MAINELHALELLDGNRTLLKELAVIYAEDSVGLVEDFNVAVQARDAEKARLAIHSLKGITASFFAEVEIGLLSRIELYASELDWDRLDKARNDVSQAVKALVVEMKDQGLLDAH
jgi:HPt (histidine-containing phosphotransfer) domain-containing protein